ncbi:hypothetical protein D3C81_1222120 [compost metagenome]
MLVIHALAGYHRNRARGVGQGAAGFAGGGTGDGAVAAIALAVAGEQGSGVDRRGIQLQGGAIGKRLQHITRAALGHGLQAAALQQPGQALGDAVVALQPRAGLAGGQFVAAGQVDAGLAAELVEGAGERAGCDVEAGFGAGRLFGVGLAGGQQQWGGGTQRERRGKCQAKRGVEGRRHAGLWDRKGELGGLCRVNRTRLEKGNWFGRFLWVGADVRG